MRYIRMFIAGAIFPSILLPFIFLFAWITGKTHIFTVPFLHILPIVWGIWNILYFTVFTKKLPGNSIVKFLITGAILGFLVALYGVFVEDMPRLVGLSSSMRDWPLLWGPILYALFWLFIVRPLNRVLGVYES